jgi:hypothetical protein
MAQSEYAEKPVTRRVTVDFSREAYEAIEQIAHVLNTTKSEALRKALGLMRFVLDERGKGAKLIIEGPERNERREIIHL